MAEQIALFPLNHVLLPGLPLPLHIFEPRYRRLVADVAAGPEPGHGSFGVVLGFAPAAIQTREPSEPVVPLSGADAAPSHRVHTAPPQLADIGTVAEVVENEPYGDGRCDLLTVGSRRFRILQIDSTSRPYLCASVEFLDEQIGPMTARDIERTGRLIGRYVDVLMSVSDAVFPSAAADSPVDGIRLSYDVAARMQLTTSERQLLLAAETAGERLTAEIALLRRELAIFGVVRAVPVPARALAVPTGVN